MYENFVFTEDKLGIKLNAFKDEKGDIWFLGKEVAEALGYKDTKQAIRKNVKKDSYKKRITNKELKIQRGLSDTSEFKKFTLNNNGAMIINEFGLYALVMNSNMTKAEEFQDWVYEEVLPSLRRNNYYIDRENITLQQLQQLQKENEELKNKIIHLQKEEDVVINNKNYYSIRDLRQMGESYEKDLSTEILKQTSLKMGLPILQEKGYYNSQPMVYNKYHFLVWKEAYKDWVTITTDYGLKIKQYYEDLKK